MLCLGQAGVTLTESKGDILQILGDTSNLSDIYLLNKIQFPVIISRSFCLFLLNFELDVDRFG